MSTTVSEHLPLVATALRRMTEADLADVAGPSAVQRGHTYCRERRVSGLRVAGPDELTASVAGSGRSRYVTSVEFDEDGILIGGNCSCPIGGDCKHVVAVALTAQQTLGTAGAFAGERASRGLRLVPAPAPLWEQLLGGLVVPPATDERHRPLGLLLEPQPGLSGAITGLGSPTMLLTLRPMVPGKTGWIKTGVSWTQLPHLAHGQVRPDPGQQDALLQLQSLAHRHHPYYAGEMITLDDLGAGWAAALRRCRLAGVTLLTRQRGSGTVTVADEPARLVLDLRRTEDGGVRLRPEVRLPEPFCGADPTDWTSVGDPPSGLWARVGDDLWLVELDEPWDNEVTTLVDHGAVDVPTDDVPRFLTGVLPVLARRLAVTSDDDSVEVAAPAPPTLHLLLTHGRGPGGTPELTLEWSWRYDVAGQRLEIGLDQGGAGAEHAAIRDGAAETALLADVAASLPQPLVRSGRPAAGAGPRPVGPYPVGRLTGFDVVDLLAQVVPGLEQRPDVEVVRAGEVTTYTETRQAPQVRMAVTDTDRTDWFDLEIMVTVGTRHGEEQVPIVDLIRALALRQGRLLLTSGTWFRLDHPALNDLARLIEEARALQDDPRGPLRISAYQTDLWSELEALGIVEEQSARWTAAVRALTADGAAPPVPSGLQATLRPYQQEGFAWLTRLRRHGLGGVLADDMGLGKTLQTLAMILQARADAEAPQAQAAARTEAVTAEATRSDRAGSDRAGSDRAGSDRAGSTSARSARAGSTSARSARGRATAACSSSGGEVVARLADAARPAPWLVVAPASVLSVWQAEAARFAPELRVALASTTGRRGAGVLAVAEDADVVVTSYAVFRLDEEAFRSLPWAGLVLDEAQVVKNHRSATYLCARRLDAPVKFAITGTPMENTLMELWALLSIVAPGLFPRPEQFTEHFRRPIESGSQPERLATLRRRIRPVMLRRTKGAVAADLPPKQEQVVHVPLPAAHRRLYDRGLARERQRVLGLLEDPERNRMAIFRALTALRRLSLHPGLADPDQADLPCAKLDTMMQLVGPVIAEGHRVLVFSQFTSFLTMARHRLDAEGVAHSYLDGGTRDRAAQVQRFRGGDTSAFLISLRAGGTGLTLTEADYVVLLDPWWNPAVEAQAVDRTHRIGQDKNVMVYRLVSADTIEDKVVALQERKRELFATVIDDGTLASGTLTPDDIRALL